MVIPRSQYQYTFKGARPTRSMEQYHEAWLLPAWVRHMPAGGCSGLHGPRAAGWSPARSSLRPRSYSSCTPRLGAATQTGVPGSTDQGPWSGCSDPGLRLTRAPERNSLTGIPKQLLWSVSPRPSEHCWPSHPHISMWPPWFTTNMLWKISGFKWARMLRGLHYLTNSPILCVLGCLLLKSREYALFFLFPQETLCWVLSVCLRMSGKEAEK